MQHAWHPLNTLGVVDVVLDLGVLGGPAHGGTNTDGGHRKWARRSQVHCTGA